MSEQRKYRTLTAQEKLELVLAGLRGDVTVMELCRSHEIAETRGSPPADHDAVLAALRGHRYAHFCCHGVSDVGDPSASVLALTDYRSKPLTVLDLTGAQLEDAELAFLSACTTARTGATLPDEPIDLAAACQLAGYRHVIATLWPIHDRDAVQVTERVYAALTRSRDRLDADDAAVALYRATCDLRERYPRQPTRWAP